MGLMEAVDINRNSVNNKQDYFPEQHCLRIVYPTFYRYILEPVRVWRVI